MTDLLRLGIGMADDEDVETDRKTTSTEKDYKIVTIGADNAKVVFGASVTRHEVSTGHPFGAHRIGHPQFLLN